MSSWYSSTLEYHLAQVELTSIGKFTDLKMKLPMMTFRTSLFLISLLFECWYLFFFSFICSPTSFGCRRSGAWAYSAHQASSHFGRSLLWFFNLLIASSTSVLVGGISSVLERRNLGKMSVGILVSGPLPACWCSEEILLVGDQVSIFIIAVSWWVSKTRSLPRLITVHLQIQLFSLKSRFFCLYNLTTSLRFFLNASQTLLVCW